MILSIIFTLIIILAFGLYCYWRGTKDGARMLSDLILNSHWKKLMDEMKADALAELDKLTGGKKE